MTAPRHFSPSPDGRPRHSAAAPGAPRNYTVGGLRTGMQAEQRSRLSARKAFVDTKLMFMQVLAQIDRHDAGVEWLRKQVRSAQMPEDLWLLRAAVESICGVKLADGQLRVQPCLPPHWPGARVRLHSGGRRIEVQVQRTPRGAGVAPPAGHRTLTPGTPLALDGLGPEVLLWVPVTDGQPVRAADTAAVL